MRAWLAALLLAAAPAWGAPFAVQLGTVRLGLDAPPGFADTAFTGSPRLQELGESLTSASNKILLFAISDADLRSFSQGDTPELRRYMIVVTPRGMAEQQVSASQFDEFVADALRGLGSPAPDDDYPKYLDAQPRGTAVLLAELRRETTVVSVLQGTRLPAVKRGGFLENMLTKDVPRYAVSTTTLLILKGKALSLSVFSGYDSPEDIAWIKATTGRWVDQLERLNRK
jgi:hypothetical protein